MKSASEGLEQEAMRRRSGSSRWVALVSSLLPLAALVGLIAIAGGRLNQVQTELATSSELLGKTEQALKAKGVELKQQERQLAQARSLKEQAEQQRAETQRAVEDTMAFLKHAADQDQLPFLDTGVPWNGVVQGLLGLDSVERRTAAFSGILAAWRETPFRFNGASLKTGIDSPRFALRMLAEGGVKDLPGMGLPADKTLRKSDEILARFPTVTQSPKPGDLAIAWVSNQSGRLVSLYLGEGTCVGIDGWAPGFQIFPCAEYISSKKWKDLEYRAVDYPGRRP